uniref:Uncharacterized protein n=1 Tax=Panagrolaimus sp. JU765 TaxID=591449 RepID=A0AC34Q7P8_9BILA
MQFFNFCVIFCCFFIFKAYSQKCPSGVFTGPCGLDGTCPSEYVCFDNVTCCRIDGCPADQQIGPCVNGDCHLGYECKSGSCCPTNKNSYDCPSGVATGPCNLDGTCFSEYDVCVNNVTCCRMDNSNSYDCPSGMSNGPCLGGSCPSKYDTCVNQVTCCRMDNSTDGCPAEQRAGRKPDYKNFVYNCGF